MCRKIMVFLQDRQKGRSHCRRAFYRNSLLKVGVDDIDSELGPFISAVLNTGAVVVVRLSTVRVAVCLRLAKCKGLKNIHE